MNEVMDFICALDEARLSNLYFFLNA